MNIIRGKSLEQNESRNRYEYNLRFCKQIYCVILECIIEVEYIINRE